MFRDVPALFITDGVPAELVRAGKPRLRSWKPVENDVAADMKPTRVPLLRRHRTLSA